MPHTSVAQWVEAQTGTPYRQVRQRLAFALYAEYAARDQVERYASLRTTWQAGDPRDHWPYLKQAARVLAWMAHAAQEEATP